MLLPLLIDRCDTACLSSALPQLPDQGFLLPNQRVHQLIVVFLQLADVFLFGFLFLQYRDSTGDVGVLFVPLELNDLERFVVSSRSEVYPGEFP